MAMKKITKRWVLNSLSIIVVIIVAVIALFSFAIRSYYYSSVRQIIVSKAGVAVTMLDNFGKDSSVDFINQMLGFVGNYEDRDKTEFMTIDRSGNVLITSSGFEPDRRILMTDYRAALASESGIADMVQTLDGEKLMAVTVLMPGKDSIVSAVRFLVSLERVDNQIFSLIVIVMLIGLAILFFVVFSSAYFINSIVNPIVEVGETAREIAQGKFEVRLQKKTDDEIGELCEIINYMALELGTAERLKNDFISSVSHELRTPLTAIKGWGETMLSDDVGRETEKKGLNVILRESDRLSAMVEELLDFSRMQSGRFSLVRSKLDLLAELGEAVLMYTERAGRENIGIYYEEPDIAAPVFGDRNRLRQVFINIIDNALKYSDPGDSVYITATADAENIDITVRDTGLGIKAEDLPKVKEKFYKANHTRRGSGIGLAVADEIIMLHGGRLDIESHEGEGTAVTIVLPLAKPGRDKPEAENTGLPRRLPPEE